MDEYNKKWFDLAEAEPFMAGYHHPADNVPCPEDRFIIHKLMNNELTYDMILLLGRREEIGIDCKELIAETYCQHPDMVFRDAVIHAIENWFHTGTTSKSILLSLERCIQSETDRIVKSYAMKIYDFGSDHGSGS